MMIKLDSPRPAETSKYGNHKEACVDDDSKLAVECWVRQRLAGGYIRICVCIYIYILQGPYYKDPLKEYSNFGKHVCRVIRGDTGT